MSCPTTSWCLGVMYNHRLAVWSAGSWTVVPVDQEYEDVSCSQVNGCGLTVTWGNYADPDFARWVGGSSVSCRSTTSCFALIQFGSLKAWDGVAWTDTGNQFGTGTTPDAFVRCYPAGRCMVITEARAWWTA